MFVSDWMTTKVYTVNPDTPLSDAIKILKEKTIKHLPVVDKRNKVIGVLSDRDIKEYMPSKATTLDVFELHNILLETKVTKVMKKKVFTGMPNLPIEEAAMLMYDKNIGCLPIVEDNGLVGIISDRDLFRVLVDVTGVRHGGNRFYAVMPDKPGITGEVLDIIKKHGFRPDSVMTTYEGVQKGYKRVVVRAIGEKGNADAVTLELNRLFGAPFL
jgi:acetoin utilization protein AcuB